MEIDVKKEKELVKAEMQNLVDSINKIIAQENELVQQKQVLTNELVKKQGELALLERLAHKPTKGK